MSPEGQTDALKVYVARFQANWIAKQEKIGKAHKPYRFLTVRGGGLEPPLCFSHQPLVYQRLATPSKGFPLVYPLMCERGGRSAHYTVMAQHIMTLKELKETDRLALTVAEVAPMFGVDRRTLTAELEKGNVPFQKIGQRRYIPIYWIQNALLDR